MSGAAGIGVRSGLAAGRKKPTVRLLAVRYFAATSLTCAGVTFSMRSRWRKIQPPVALRGPLAQLDRDRLGSCGGQLAILEDALPGAVDLFLGDAGARHLLDHREHRVADLLQHRAVLGVDLGHDLERARVVEATARTAETLRGLLGLDQGLVEPARGLGVEDLGQDLDRRELGVRRRPGCGRSAPTSPTLPTRRSVTNRSPSWAGSSV